MAGTLSVAEFYSGRSVLVTGATGFMGKVLLEKLLRCCPGLERIYILCRAKRGLTPAGRVVDILKLPVFERLRKDNPSVLKKLTAVEGDVTLPDLGLKAEAKATLLKEVSVVFNGAASLRLEWGMKAAVESNTFGTKKILDLCTQMENLVSFVHLSTAFCHCEYDILEETVYPSPVDPHDVMRVCQWMDDTSLELITPRLLGPHPNCYTYSKRLAEALVNEYGQRIPVAIARPSIVTPALREPMPGWVDSLNGPVGVMVAAGKGVIRSMICSEHYRAEVIPVDIAINAVLTIGAARGTNKHDPDQPTPCYNLSSGEVVPMTWGEVLERGRSIGFEYPFEGGLWYPSGTIRTNPITHALVVFFLQTIPAYLIDFIMVIIRQKTFMVRVQNRISVGMQVLQYFTVREWCFRTECARGLTAMMTPSDQDVFYVSNADYDIYEYLKNSVLGARQYCMKEPLSTLPRARQHMRMLYWIDLITKCTLLLLVGWLLIGWLEGARDMAAASTAGLKNVPIIRSFVPI